jgi:hypothetical protein
MHPFVEVSRPNFIGRNWIPQRSRINPAFHPSRDDEVEGVTQI